MEEFERLYPHYVRFKRFRVLALDGTCLKLPNWKDLTDHSGTASNGRGRKVPRAPLVSLLLPFARMPVSYRLGKYTQSEQALAREVLGCLRADDLVLMDKGFWSFGLFYQIQNRDAFFATRLEGRSGWNKGKELGPDDELVIHSPKDWRKSWKKQGLPAEIKLRVIRYQLEGFRPSAIVTNVLDSSEISREEWVRMAEADKQGKLITKAGLYHHRWEIETSYRELKCEQGLEGSLRSRKPEGIHYEVGGHLLLYTLIRWRIAEAAAQQEMADPLRLSFSGALDTLEVMMWVAWLKPEQDVLTVLLPRLLERFADHEVPFRPGRQFPRPLDGKYKNKGKKKRKKAKPQTTEKAA